MSRIKRFATGASAVLILLSGSTTLWYKNHYLAPLSPPPAHLLPSPNGYDTLKIAGKLLVRPEPTYPMDMALDQDMVHRQRLLNANNAYLAKVHEALAQDYLMPESESARLGYLDTLHQYMLLFAAGTYADSGKLPEAMQCALDAIELGVLVPRGGDFKARGVGYNYETCGRDVAWDLVNRIDAPTARRAIERLEKMELRHWPLAESLRENLRLRNLDLDLTNFKRGPVFVWQKTAFEAPDRDRTTSLYDRVQTLWNRAQVMYYGPQAVIDHFEQSVRDMQKQSELPWNPEGDYQYPYEQSAELSRNTDAALLRTYLALRAYKLEHGAYPQSLEQLVSAGYLKTLPVDPFSSTRAPLRYRPDSQLWSIGPDARDDNSLPVADVLARPRILSQQRRLQPGLYLRY